MMTRKQYKAIAEIVKKHRFRNDTASWRMVKELADYFATDNLRFDHQKFIKACL